MGLSFEERVHQAKLKADEAREQDRIKAEEINNAKIVGQVRQAMTLEEGVAQRARGEAAAKQTRETVPFDACVECARVRIDWRLAVSPDAVIRQTVTRSIMAALARLSVWHDAICNIERLRAMGKHTVDAAPAEEIAALVADDLRNLIKAGLASVTVIE